MINSFGSSDCQCIEYFVSIGPGSYNGPQKHRMFRSFGPLSMHDGMDASYTYDGENYANKVETWTGNAWEQVTYGCNGGDAGPCWEPSQSNCCSLSSSNEFTACDGGTGAEGQWSHDNTNQ